ncbi:MAG: hypothetical protein DWQ31_17980 [Planctomycetota bacterium]|nr:MAG: hypothetical protein DWQ31_17980 [Planctomycetota bacterium]REJ92365.1 MAG: hypothetical protein DWQ35_12355 [Planctomycetota bacterium]REK30243.1 MAG: hypothetical protein DWQ42_02410 [Planctomycetota bacterium]REK44584.1 MAG: hypothetical protein DWQ46_09130 [Planctomycetota bacterium]
MDAQLAKTRLVGAPVRSSADYLPGDATRYFSIIALLVCVAALLAWRRFDGALGTPLSWPVALVAGTLLGLAALAALVGTRGPRWATRISRPAMRRTLLAAWSLLPHLATAVVLATLCLPGTEFTALVALWSPLGVAVALSLGMLLPTRQNNQAASTGETAGRRNLRFDTAHTADTSPVVPAPHFPPENASQQMIRLRTPEGQDVCHGWVRATFDEGQQHQVVHLAFCPPFQTRPELATSLADGQAVEIRHAQLMPYGARVELKRDRSERQSATALLRFSATELRDAS